MNSISDIDINPYRSNRDGKFYSVWYNHKKYPCKGIIDRCYKLKSLINPHKDFVTDSAQERLIELGFPIIENEKSSAKSFFSEKDLDSFGKLVKRKKYDNMNEVDRNIGSYLNNIIWGKTSHWADLVKDEHLIKSGGKQWNSQHKELKQVYKSYTWIKLIPIDSENKDIYFTVGMHNNDELIYKMDIQRNSEFFTEERAIYFQNRLKELGIESHLISKQKLKYYNWDKLVDETKKFIDLNLVNYHKIVKELSVIRPMKAARICWNTFGWTEPSGREGKSTLESYESLTGFGHDEWIFDLESTYEGFCYARIEPVNKSRKKLNGKKIDLILFTYRQETKKMEWVGKITNAKIIGSNESTDVHTTDSGQKWFHKRFEQLSDIEGINKDAYKNTDSGDMYNLKFLPQNVEIFDSGTMVNENLFKLPRYVLFDVDSNDMPIASLDSNSFEPQADAISGMDLPPLTNKRIKRRFTVETREYEDIHYQIQSNLIHYLNQAFPNGKITYENSLELTNRKIDVVLKENGKTYYYEVKSYPKLSSSIRVAIGQLMEYCFYNDSHRADQLIIVSHLENNKSVEKFLSHLRAKLGLQIYYMQFDLKEKKLVDNSRFN
jgi:hypothetical protein